MAAGSTYTVINTQTLASNQATVTFSSIPQTYTDLVLILGNVASGGSQQPVMQFNGNTGGNYSWLTLTADGTTQGGVSASNTNFIQISYFDYLNGNKVYTGIYNINSYTNANIYKTALCRGNNPQTGLAITAGTWRNTAAITSIEIKTSGGADILTGSVFTLYGIAAA